MTPLSCWEGGVFLFKSEDGFTLQRKLSDLHLLHLHHRVKMR